MAALSEDMIALIDQRVRAAQARTRATGTCVDRDTTGPGATVIFDGDVMGVPVKVLGDVFLREGHRCLLDKYGSDWIVTGSFASYALGEVTSLQFPSAALSTTVVTYADVTTINPFTFTKTMDGTKVRMAVHAGCYVTGTASTGARFGLTFTPTSGQVYTPIDYNLAAIYHNQLSLHLPGYGQQRVAGLPAGSYSVQLRWRRLSGTGTCTCDSNDLMTMEVVEWLNSGAPIL